MQLRMEPTLVDAVRVYADLVRERTGVRTVSVAEATRMAIRAGLVAAGVDPDDPHATKRPASEDDARPAQPSDHEALRAFDPREGLKAFKGADPLTSRPGGRRE